MLLISAIVTGLAVGSMYGLIALGYHVTYVVSNTVNFSQGSSMMLGAVLGYTFAIRLGWPLPLAVAMALLLCALFRSCGRAFPGAAVCRARAPTAG
jgi:branched-chain amino acid transport system permease protein